jgi:allophanate hydrolase subunit 2
MGYRLQGNCLRAMRGEIVSDAIPVGALQVLPSGQLILLMVDRPTVGGYPKIAVVCSADLPKCAQLCIGDSVKFDVLTIERSIDILREQERRILVDVVSVE